MAAAPPGSFGAFLNTFPATTTRFKQTADRLTEMLKRAEELVVLGRRWETEPTIRGGSIPRPDTDLRVTPKA